MPPKSRDPRREIAALRRAADAGASPAVSADVLAELLRGYDDGLALRGMIDRLDKLDGSYAVSGIPFDRELCVVIVTSQNDPARHAAVFGESGPVELPSTAPHGRETPARAARRCAEAQIGVHAIVDLTLHGVGMVLVPREGRIVRVRAYACTNHPACDLGDRSTSGAFWAPRAELFAHPALGDVYARIFRRFDAWSAEAAKKDAERKGAWKNLV